MINKERVSSFGIGLLMGAVIGLAIGFLYAPRRGAETRELIKEKAEDVKEKAEKIVEKAKEKTGEIVAKAKEKATEVRGQGEE